MQPLRIVIDVRHINDFGIGTYIRNLVKAIGELDQFNRYLLAANYTDVPDIIAPDGDLEVMAGLLAVGPARGAGHVRRSLGAE